MSSYEDSESDNEEEEQIWGHCPKRRQTKREAIYGWFLSSDDNSDDGSSNNVYSVKGQKYKKNRHSVQTNNSTRRVQFVSGGVCSSTILQSDNIDRSVNVKKKKLSGVLDSQSINKSKEEEEELIELYSSLPNKSNGIIIGYASSSSSSEEEIEQNDTQIYVESFQHKELTDNVKKNEMSSVHHHHHHHGLGSLEFPDHPIATHNDIEKEDMIDSQYTPQISYKHKTNNETLMKESHIVDNSMFRFSDLAHQQREAAKLAKQKRQEENEKKKNIQMNIMGSDKMTKMYGKGFKLLQKMGYSGGGLGKKGSGVLNPLSVNIRQKYRGLQDSGEKINTSCSKSNKSSLYSSDSAIDLLLNKKEKHSRNDHFSNVSKTSSQQWQKDSVTDHSKRIYRTANEIAAEARIQQKELLESIQDTHQSKKSYIGTVIDMDDDENSLINSKHMSQRNPLYTQRLRLAKLQATGTADLIEQPPVPFRIIDMTGPTQKVLKDVNDLHIKLSEASEMAEESIRFQAVSMNPSDTMSFLNLKASEVKEGVLSQESEHNDDTLHPPLSELKHNIEVCINGIEADIISTAKEKVLEENRFQIATKKEIELHQQDNDLSDQITILSAILKDINTLRQSKDMKKVEQYLIQHNKVKNNYHTQLSHLDGQDSNLVKREAAIKKYTLMTSTMNTSDNEIEPQKIHISPKNISCNEPTADCLDSRNAFVLPQDVLLDQEDKHLQPIDCPIATTHQFIYALFREIITLFSQLYKQYPIDYIKLRLPYIATQFGDTLLEYFYLQNNRQCLSDIPHDPFYLTSLLVEIRDQCIPNDSMDIHQEIKELRFIWEKKITEHAIEGLRSLLCEFAIIPGAQDLRPLLTVFDWIGPVPLPIITQLLHTLFFPKWLQTLQVWLDYPGANLEEIYIWYNGWKSIFPESLALDPTVQASFMSGLLFINAYLEKQHYETLSHDTTISTPTIQDESILVNSNSSINHPLSDTHHTQSESIPKIIPLPTTSPPPVPESLSPLPESDYPLATVVGSSSTATRILSASRLIEVLEAVAEENNILMIPKHGRMHHGKQIYGFGTVSIYIDRGVIRCLSSSSGEWNCVSLGCLLERVTKIH